MSKRREATALLCAMLLAAPGTAGAQNASSAQGVSAGQSATRVPAVQQTGSFQIYRPKQVAPIDLANSNRLDSLLRGGRLYLSLQDAIALALENNLDIEVQRYGPLIADANILRAKGGGFARGVSAGVSSGPSSAASQGEGRRATGITTSAATEASSAGAGGGLLVQQTGSAIPSLDPVISGIARFSHATSPQTSSFVTGTNNYVRENNLMNFQYSQGFLTGTNFSFGYSDSRVETNSVRDDFNPARTGSFSLNITQKLLQGFGPAVNSRQIRIARNNREVSDLVFKQQVIATVSTVMNLYWDLVSFNEEVKVAKQTLAANEKLYNDNRKQVEIGTLAPISIVQAEAEVAAAQQEVTLAETRVLQQETILKNYLSRTGIASPLLADARVVPTDRMTMPDVEPIQPFQDMVAGALQSRPEAAQRRINIENAKISMKGSRSQMLPTLDAFVSLANNALAGTVNGLPAPVGVIRNPDAYFLGGYSTLFSQLFGRNFPDYAVGLQLNIPLRNRQAQADMLNDQLSLRQGELGLQQLENQIRVEVQNALIGLQQARASYQAAMKRRVLQEQTLDAEQKKLALGASTIYQVILVQRDLTQAQSAEVAALASYSKARVEMDRALGLTLNNHSISLEEAYNGRVSRPPSPIPAVEQP
ncbi:MAG: TolC family protein [Bryobacterales bacterium]|nr:TolC family protein [Bryobacterales bacterium]